MKTKTKIIVSMVSLCLVVVAAVVSIVAVFALINNGINIGGSISFTAKNIYATVSAGTLSGGTLEDAGNKLKQIDYSATSDGSSTLSSWSNLNLTFPESGEDVTIEFTVANHSTSSKLKVSIGELVGTANNATMTIAFTGKGNKTTVVIDKKTGEESPSVEVVITFHVVNTSDSASIKDFNIPLTLEKFDGYNILLNVEYSNPSATDWSYGMSVATDLGECVDFAFDYNELSDEFEHVVIGESITFALLDIGCAYENPDDILFYDLYLCFTILVEGDTYELYVEYDRDFHMPHLYAVKQMYSILQ